jgi:hypothetical protein
MQGNCPLGLNVLIREVTAMKLGKWTCWVLLGFCLWMAGGSTVLQAASVPNRYSVAGIEDAAEFEKTFAAVQAAVAVNARSKVADHILYPLRVNGWKDEVKGKGTVKFDTRQEVLDNYDEIFTPQIKTALAKQKVAELFVNWQGVMVGNGEIWLSVSEKEPRRYGIISVNLVQ